MQLSLRKRWSKGYQFDVNYTLAHAQDHGSPVERAASSRDVRQRRLHRLPDQLVGAGPAVRQLRLTTSATRSTSTGSPTCRSASGTRIGSDSPGCVNAIIGEWSVAGLWRWTSGLPVQRPELPLVLGDELEPAGQRGAGEARAAARDAARSRTSSTATRARSRIPRTPLTLFRRSSRRVRACATCCAATATSPSTSASARRGRCRGRTTSKLRFRWDMFNLTNTPRFDIGRRRHVARTSRTRSAATTARWPPATAAPAAACSSCSLRILDDRPR